MHYHIIPAPKFRPITESDKGVEATDSVVGGRAPLTRREMHQKEFEARGELDEDDAKVLLPRIRAHL